MFDKDDVNKTVLITNNVENASGTRKVGEVTEGRINGMAENGEGREFVGIVSEGYQLFASCDTGEVFVTNSTNPGELMSVATVALKEEFEA